MSQKPTPKEGPSDAAPARLARGCWNMPQLLVAATLFSNGCILILLLLQSSQTQTQWARLDQDLASAKAVARKELLNLNTFSKQVLRHLQASNVVASESAHLVVRASHRGTHKLCSYPDPELRRILLQVHHCAPAKRRYFCGGAWMNWNTLHRRLNPPRPKLNPRAVPAERTLNGSGNIAELGGGDESEVVCVLACKSEANYGCSHKLPCVHALYLRKGTSDTLVLRQLYEWNEHEFLKPRFKFRTILDAGGNIGISSVLFATVYPDAKIVSVEASRENFKVLRRAVEPFPNIFPINAALWPRVAPLSLVVGPRNLEQAPQWGFMVVETSKVTNESVVEPSLAGISAPFLLKILGLPSFDFVKMDIEGGEGELLTADTPEEAGWVDQTKMFALELHGDMAPGSNETVHKFFARRPNFVLHKYTKILEDFSIYMRRDAFPP